MSRFLIVGLVAACSGGTSSSPPPGSTPPPRPGAPGDSPTTPPTPPTQTDLDALGQPCGDGDACTTGTCTTYYGIAGPRGPEFKSCEITCAKGETCPTGTACRTVADGPGQVCRP